MEQKSLIPALSAKKTNFKLVFRDGKEGNIT